MSKWFYTDDMQICRKVKDGVFELVGFSECDERYSLLEKMTIILKDWKDSNGEWNRDAQSIINSYYWSLDGMRECVSPKDEDQFVAEIIYESTSSLADELSMTKKEAVEYLDKIVGRKEEQNA